jgi:hypothetical protein
MQQQQQQPQSQNTTQPVMTQPPQVMTTKDLSYLSDHLSWQLIAIKKCYHYANECTDQDVKNMLNRAGQMHIRHYQLLLKHCQNQNNQMMANLQRQQTQ